MCFYHVTELNVLDDMLFLLGMEKLSAQQVRPAKQICGTSRKLPYTSPSNMKDLIVLLTKSFPLH